MNWRDSQENRLAWKDRHCPSFELALFFLIVAGMIILALMVLFLPLSARAAACLSIDVPPQAVIDQYDGDTFTLFAFAPGGQVKIRVQGVDTPERTKKEPGWEAAREFTKRWLAKGPFHLTTCGKQTIDRIVATIERDGRTLAQDLIAAGHAKPPQH